jgi:hypothetical protein
MNISPSDSIYVQFKGNIQSIGSGYKSEGEIEEYIQSNFEKPREYTYGIFSKVGSVQIEEPEPKEEKLSQTTLERLDDIEERVEEDERVDSFGRLDNPKYGTHVTRFTQNIRYENNEADFSITLKNELFDDVPLSTIDQDIESRMEEIFYDIVGDNGIFLGYDSNYASRGQRNPFVRVVGRVKRDTKKDKTIRSLSDLDFIAGLYWSEENISPVKSHLTPNYNYDDDSDIITVFDITDTVDTFDELEEETLNKLEWIISQIEDRFDLECMWSGQVQFNGEFDHTCAGFTYTGE